MFASRVSALRYLVAGALVAGVLLMHALTSWVVPAADAGAHRMASHPVAGIAEEAPAAGVHVADLCLFVLVSGGSIALAAPWRRRADTGTRPVVELAWAPRRDRRGADPPRPAGISLLHHLGVLVR